MTATPSQTRSLPRPMINWFEASQADNRICPLRLENMIFTVRPCSPMPNQPVIDAVLVAELSSEG